MFAFSATSSISYEKLILKCIVKPLALEFKSEYELIYEVSAISIPTIQNCSTPDQLLLTLYKGILKFYESKPIIVIHEKE